MVIIDYLKGVINRMFKKDSREAYREADVIQSTPMELAHNNWVLMYKGAPTWLDADDKIKTINFSKTISSEMARLVTLDIDVSIEGSARGEHLNKRIQRFMPNIKEVVEKWCEHGSIILVPNSIGIDVITPYDFYITHLDGNKNITGIIYFDYYVSGLNYFTRAVWHRFEDCVYHISNKAFMSKANDILGKEVDLSATIWAKYLPDTYIVLGEDGNEELERPLFSVLNLPTSNNIDEYSPLSVALFADAVTEMEDLDVAYSRFVTEIFDSSKLVLADDRLLMTTGTKLGTKNQIKLPHYILNVYGNAPEEFYQEIVPSLNPDDRIKGINQILDIISYKIGFSNGYFRFDEKTGAVTATQVESQDARTIDTVKTFRDCLQSGIDNLIYAINIISDLDSVQVGEYEVNYSFGDITYNYDEDKARWLQYILQDLMPKWLYFVKFEKMTEEEAKAYIEEAKESIPEEPSMFGGAK
jgi:A118 family predicted phage portal protein